MDLLLIQAILVICFVALGSFALGYLFRSQGADPVHGLLQGLMLKKKDKSIEQQSKTIQILEKRLKKLDVLKRRNIALEQILSDKSWLLEEMDDEFSRIVRFSKSRIKKKSDNFQLELGMSPFVEWQLHQNFAINSLQEMAHVDKKVESFLEAKTGLTHKQISDYISRSAELIDKNEVEIGIASPEAGSLTKQSPMAADSQSQL